jgi:hypothetical protein
MMKKLKVLFPLLFIVQIVNGQNSDVLFIRSSSTEKPIKNVNVLSLQNDTVLVSDTSGIVDLKGFPDFDSLTIKKFGYFTKTLYKNERNIYLSRDSTIYSHNLKLLDLKHKDGYSFIKLKINGEDFWFKQNIGYLSLGNGKEIENYNDYMDIFRNHKIIKTISVTTEYCLWNIRGENYANWVEAIYYDPTAKKRKTDYIPGNTWTNKRDARKDGKKLKLTSGCLD